MEVAPYSGRYAELYDLFYSDKRYDQEASFIDRLLRENASQPVQLLLEIACGTGTNACLMQEKGYTVVATDRSEDMLACARRKNDAVVFRHQDMCQLDVPERPFDAILCLFDSIGYVRSTEAVLQILRGVRDHLQSGGLFLFDFWHAAAMLRAYEPLRVRRWSTPLGEVIRLVETRLDVERSLAEVIYTVFDPRGDGTYVVFRENHVNRYFLCEEMAGMADRAGLEVVSWFNGYSTDKPITQGTWHVLALLRRP
jgi:SAM-dependent methyltransferase